MASLAERYKRAKGVNRPASSSDRDKGTSEAGSLLRAFLLKPDDIGKWGKAFAKDDQKATLKDLVGMRDKDRTNLAEGGEVESEESEGHETNEKDDDIVSRIMNKFYAEGGEIANKTKISEEKQIDFPDLSDTEIATIRRRFHEATHGERKDENPYTKSNDQLSTERHALEKSMRDRPKNKDIVSRIMKKRAKKC